MRPAVSLLACCWACLGGTQPTYDYYILTSSSVASPAGRPEVREQPTVALSQVTIPRYLERDSIVTRTDDYRVVYSNKERWAEPLEEAFSRTLRQDLAASLAPAGIAVPSHVGAPTYDVQVDILRFERRGTQQVELWARWTLRASGEPAQTHDARIEVAIAGPDSSASAAAALSDAIGRLATKISYQVKVAAAEINHKSPG